MCCPFAIETAFQVTGESRFVADSKLKLVVLVGQVKTTLVPAGVMVSCGCGNEKLNTVPSPELPPRAAVPYKVLPDIINKPAALLPSLLVGLEGDGKAKRFANPVPFVLKANIVLSEDDIPYKVLPDKVKPG